MAKKKSKLENAREEAQAAVNKTNERIEALGNVTATLYSELSDIQMAFDAIRNVPSEKRIQYEELKQIRLSWKQQAEKIEKDYKTAAIKDASTGAAGTGLGIAVVTMGPTVAMGVATTFGVASTGTAISALSGAAATNAALAWLGGGALAVGGGGMAAGNAFLALAGPIGWAIAGVSLLASGILLLKSHINKRAMEDLFTLISKRDVTSYELAIVESNERITRIIDESEKLEKANEDIRSFGLDYNSMSEAQQYALGAYVNLMLSSTQLLINPIFGLLPKYTEEELEEFISQEINEKRIQVCSEHKSLIVALANFIYKIEISESHRKLLWKYLRNNKEFLESLNISKKEFSIDLMDVVVKVLNYKYKKAKLSKRLRNQ